MNQISLSSTVDEAPIVAIVRRPKVDPVRCIEHLYPPGRDYHGTSNAVEVLEYFRSRVPANCLLGPGTVTAVELAEVALGAGARLLSPRI